MLECQAFDRSEALQQDPVVGSVRVDRVDRSPLNVGIKYSSGFKVVSESNRILQEFRRGDGRKRRIWVGVVEHVSRFDARHSAVDEEGVE